MFLEIKLDRSYHPEAATYVLVNIERIGIIQGREGGCLVITKDFTYYVTNHYEEICRAMGKAVFRPIEDYE